MERMTAAEFVAAKEELGLTDEKFGQAIGWSGDPGRNVRRIKSGKGGITGPVAYRVRELLRIHRREQASIAGGWIIGEGGDGDDGWSYLIHTRRPAYIGRLGGRTLRDITILAWLDDPGQTTPHLPDATYQFVGDETASSRRRERP